MPVLLDTPAERPHSFSEMVASSTRVLLYQLDRLSARPSRSSEPPGLEAEDLDELEASEQSFEDERRPLRGRVKMIVLDDIPHAIDFSEVPAESLHQGSCSIQTIGYPHDATDSASRDKVIGRAGNPQQSLGRTCRCLG